MICISESAVLLRCVSGHSFFLRFFGIICKSLTHYTKNAGEFCGEFQKKTSPTHQKCGIIIYGDFLENYSN